jgi:hypothetical protein
MTVGGFRAVYAQRKRIVGLTSLLGALACMALALPSVSGATVLAPFGPDLSSTTPTLDTANGDYHHDGTATPSTAAISPQNHDGADLAVWNSSPSYVAPADGQILQLRVKGCAVKDTTVPAQDSTGSGTGTDGQQYSVGVPVNTINFQTLKPNTPSTGSYQADQTAPAGQLFPFCSDSVHPSQGTVSTTTVTTFQPVHFCIRKGEAVNFYDIGGNVPERGANNPTGPWYPQGVPFMVIANTGAGINSFADADQINHTGQTAVYSPGGTIAGTPNSGWGQVGSEQLMLQVVEGVGDDAYGQCPGGDANEPTNSNSVNCVERHTSPGDPYGTCDGNSRPVYPPANNAPPTISGTATQNSRLTGAPGTWSNSPYGYSYQWTDCDASGANCTAIDGTAAKQAYYYPTATDVGHALVLQVSASNQANTIGPASSAPTALVTASTLPPPPPPATGPPVITGLGLNPSSFNSARGTTIVYNDSQTGTATFRIFALEPGVTRGRSCIAPPKKKPKGAKKCTREVLVKTFTHADRGGQNGVKLTGVKPGKYVLQVTAKSSANGKSSQPVVVNFTSRLVHTTLHHARLASVWSGLSWLV